MNTSNKSSKLFTLNSLEILDDIICLIKEIDSNIDIKRGILRYNGGQENIPHYRCPDINQFTKADISYQELIKELERIPFRSTLRFLKCYVTAPVTIQQSYLGGTQKMI